MKRLNVAASILLPFLVLSCAFGAGGSAGETSISLGLGAIPQMDIVTTRNPTPQEANAAAELKHYLSRIVGGGFVSGDEAGVRHNSKAIYVGRTLALAKAFPDLDIAKLGQEGIALKNKDGDIFIAGGAPRGTLYAAYSFLEDVCGVRWWTPLEEDVPSNPNLKIAPPDLIYVPPFNHHEAWYLEFRDDNCNQKLLATDGGRDARIKFCVRMKNNGASTLLPPEWGGNKRILGWCHTFYRLIPCDKYFKDHPEWFSEIDGTRLAGDNYTQLCLSNEEMRKELLKNALEWIAQDPDAGAISISQNDNGRTCQCHKCRLIDAEEGVPSGTLLRFVNSIAADIEKRYPGFLVSTLAYQHTQKPPRITKPRSNVHIMFCAVFNSDGPNRFDDQSNHKSRQFMDDLKGWGALTDKLFVWDYLIFYGNVMKPMASSFNLGPNIKTLAANKVVGVFAQGNCYAAYGDFDQLKAWLVSKMLWNPSLDDKALILEFLNGYYGKAGTPLHGYLRLLAAAGGKLSLDGMNQATRLFDDAERQVSDNPDILERVKQARLSFDLQWILGYDAYKLTAKKEGKPFRGPTDLREFFNVFKADCVKWNINALSEGTSALSVSILDALVNQPPRPLPPPYDKLPIQNVVDVSPMRFALCGGPEQTGLINDPGALNGKAAYMMSNHKEWVMQFHHAAMFGVSGRWRCLVSARMEGISDAGKAFDLGVYNGQLPSPLASPEITDFKDGKYHLVDCGVFDFARDSCLWLAPKNNPDQVGRILVDRVLLVKEQ